MAISNADSNNLVTPDREESPGPRVLAILPHSDVVLFPRIIMPLVLWEERSQKLVDEALLQEKTIGIVASREEQATGFGPTISIPWAPRPRS